MNYTPRVILGINEQHHNGVRFLHKKGISNKVIVTFSSFAPHSVEQNYNYIKDFINSNDTVISFLDRNVPLDDPRGTYYLDDDCGDGYLNTINDIITQLYRNTSKSDIYLVGSSKGATAALLLGLTFNYPNIYILAPQCKIATYIKRRSNIILNFLTKNSNLIYEKLDEILVKKITSCDNSLNWNIHILCGLDDKYHLSELDIIDNCLSTNNIFYQKVIIDGAHDMVAIKIYREYLKTHISKC